MLHFLVSRVCRKKAFKCSPTSNRTSAKPFTHFIQFKSCVIISNLRPHDIQLCAGVQAVLSVWSLLLLLLWSLDSQLTRELGIILVIAHLFTLSETKQFSYFSQLFHFIYLFKIFACTRVSIALHRLSLIAVSGGKAWLWCLSFSCGGSLVAARGLRCMSLAALWHVKYSHTRNRTCVPCIGRQTVPPGKSYF